MEPTQKLYWCTLPIIGFCLFLAGIVGIGSGIDRVFFWKAAEVEELGKISDKIISSLSWAFQMSAFEHAFTNLT